MIWAAEFARTAPVADLLFSRAGLSWYGGLIGGVGAGLVALRVMRAPLVTTLAAAAPALAVGHMLGRVGCLLVGDDYGRPSRLPWAVAFPKGRPPTDVPVHPTQLYEALFLGWLTWLLIREQRRGVPDRLILGHYMILAGVFRFILEFIRINQPVVFGFTLAQILAFILAATGALLLTRASSPRARQSRRAPS